MTVLWHQQAPASWAAVFPGFDDADVVIATEFRNTLTDHDFSTPRSAAAPDDDRPLASVPDVGMPRFRAEAFRTLTADQFSAFDAVYRSGAAAACRYLCSHRLYQAITEHNTLTSEQLQLPAEIAGRDAEAAVGLLRELYGPDRIATLTEGLLCLGRRSGRATVSVFDDRDGMQWFLSDLAGTAPTPRHAVAAVRGAQAGFLAHGLLLAVPVDLPHRAGPGLTTVRLDDAAAAAIRRAVAHPQLAAALALTMITGASVDALKQLQAAPGFGRNRDTVVIGATHSRRRTVWAVPAAARPILDAGRAFIAQRHGSRALASALLTGLYLGEDRLQRAARDTGLPYPAANPAAADAELPQSWHAAATAWWVGDPLHGPGPVPHNRSCPVATL